MPESLPEDAQGSARFKPGSWPPGHLGAVTLRSWSGQLTSRARPEQVAGAWQPGAWGQSCPRWLSSPRPPGAAGVSPTGSQTQAGKCWQQSCSTTREVGISIPLRSSLQCECYLLAIKTQQTAEIPSSPGKGNPAGSQSPRLAGVEGAGSRGEGVDGLGGRRVLGGLGSPADLHRRAGGSETEVKTGPDAGAPGSRVVGPPGAVLPPSPVHPSSANDRTHFANEDLNLRMQSFKHGQPGGPGLLRGGACRQQVRGSELGCGLGCAWNTRPQTPERQVARQLCEMMPTFGKKHLSCLDISNPTGRK